MGTTVSSLRRSVGLVAAQPAYLLVGGSIVLLAHAVGYLLGLVPVVGGVGALFLLALYNTALLGLAYTASRLGRPETSAIRHAVRYKYPTVVGAYAVSSLLVAVLGAGLAVALGMGAGATLPALGVDLGAEFGVESFRELATNPPAPSLSAGAIATETAILLAAAAAGLAIPWALLQFVGPAVVVDDESVLGAVGASLAVARSHPLSVLGYTVVRGSCLVLFLLVPLALAAPLIAAGSLSPSDTTGLAALAVLALVQPIVYAWSLAYHVEFYRAA